MTIPLTTLISSRYSSSLKVRLIQLQDSLKHLKMVMKRHFTMTILRKAIAMMSTSMRVQRLKIFQHPLLKVKHHLEARKRNEIGARTKSKTQ